MSSKADLGIRHVLPVYPLLFLLVGYAISKCQKWRYVFVALFIWLLAVMIAAYPYYISYFNNLAGGSYNGYKITNDSNLDWGQDLPRIASYIKNNNLKNIYIDYAWDGGSALDYFLGKGDYKLLSDWSAGDGGYAIINSSDFDTSTQYKYLQSCFGLKQVTPSVFICQLPK